MIDPPQLHQHLFHTRLLGSISSALYYNQNTEMPAAKVRSGKGFSAGGADDTSIVSPRSRCTWGSAERRRQMRGSPCAGEGPAGIPPGQWLKAPAPVPESRAPAAA